MIQGFRKLKKKNSVKLIHLQLQKYYIALSIGFTNVEKANNARVF